MKRKLAGKPRQRVAAAAPIALALAAALLGAVLPAFAAPDDEDPNGPSLDPDVVSGKKADRKSVV